MKKQTRLYNVILPIWLLGFAAAPYLFFIPVY